MAEPPKAPEAAIFPAQFGFPVPVWAPNVIVLADPSG